MVLSRHTTPHGARWARDGKLLPERFSLELFLQLPKDTALNFLKSLPTLEPVDGGVLAPVEPHHEVWASGVTYLRSREARMAESETKDVYDKVYEAERPELFFKASGWRVVSDGQPVRIRVDSHWNVPEPELVLVVNRDGEILGYTVGNDMSSRDIEGDNPLYLPQAKIYNGSCALGPAIVLTEVDELRDLPVNLEIRRNGETAFAGETRTSQIKRQLEELVGYLVKELDFPHGVFLMTGTGVVPPEAFTLQAGDEVRITIGSLTLTNRVAQ
jgi:2-dehydro-3-deoxy-D-arabinonate dehydratase